MKNTYLFPKVKKDDLQNMSLKRFRESISEKIIIGGMNKELECIYDNGEYLAGKSTTIVYNHPHLKYITALLNSTLMTYYYKTVFNSMSLAGGFYRIGAPQIKTLPIAITDDKTIEILENLVDRVQFSMQNNDILSAQMFVEQIDSIVYKVYKISKEEINIIIK